MVGALSERQESLSAGLHPGHGLGGYPGLLPARESPGDPYARPRGYPNGCAFPFAFPAEAAPHAPTRGQDPGTKTHPGTKSHAYAETRPHALSHSPSRADAYAQTNTNAKTNANTHPCATPSPAGTLV